MNHTDLYEMTILVPLYNEKENLRRLEEKLSAYLDHSRLRSCVLFVDDGSTDQGLKEIKAICERNLEFFYISLDRNHGLSTALKAGIQQCESPFVGYIDADLQTSPEDFNYLIPFLDTYELVSGIRLDRKDSWLKRKSSLIGNSFRRMITKDKTLDTGCPLKIMKTSVARQLPLFKGMHRFIPALVELQGGKVKQIPIAHYPRIAGKSKYNLRNRLFGPFIDCLVFCWMKKRNHNYKIQDMQL